MKTDPKKKKNENVIQKMLDEQREEYSKSLDEQIEKLEQHLRKLRENKTALGNF